MLEKRVTKFSKSKQSDDNPFTMPPSYTNRSMSRYRMIEDIAKGQLPDLYSDRGGQASKMSSNPQDSSHPRVGFESRRPASNLPQRESDYPTTDRINGANHMGGDLPQRNDLLEKYASPQYASQGNSQGRGYSKSYVRLAVPNDDLRSNKGPSQLF